MDDSGLKNRQILSPYTNYTLNIITKFNDGVTGRPAKVLRLWTRKYWKHFPIACVMNVEYILILSAVRWMKNRRNCGTKAVPVVCPQLMIFELY